MKRKYYQQQPPPPRRYRPPSHLNTVDDLRAVKWNPLRPTEFYFNTRLWAEEFPKPVSSRLLTDGSLWQNSTGANTNTSDTNDNKSSTDKSTKSTKSTKSIESTDWMRSIVPAELMSTVDNLKNLLDDADRQLFTMARGLVNPYEKIGKMNFQNRSAVKLLEIDYRSRGRILNRNNNNNNNNNNSNSNSSSSGGDAVVVGGGRQSVLDIGGPGGFSELIFELSREDDNRRSSLSSSSSNKIIAVGITISSGSNGSDVLDWSLATTNPRNPNCTFFEYYGPGNGTIDNNGSSSSSSSNIGNNYDWTPENNGDVTKPAILRGMMKPSKLYNPTDSEEKKSEKSEKIDGDNNSNNNNSIFPSSEKSASSSPYPGGGSTVSSGSSNSSIDNNSNSSSSSNSNNDTNITTSGIIHPARLAMIREMNQESTISSSGGGGNSKNNSNNNSNNSNNSIGSSSSRSNNNSIANIKKPPPPRKFGNGGLTRFPLVLADGGFSVEGDEANQELRHIHLILSSFLYGIICCEPSDSNNIGGAEHQFLCKIFDQRFFLSNYIILLIAQFFQECTIDKPAQSRPASAERYVYFFNRQPDKSDNSSDLSNLTQWLYSLFIAIDKYIYDGSRNSNSNNNSSNTSRLSKRDYQQILENLPFSPPIPPADCHKFVLWKHLMDAQIISEEIQGENLMAIHEVLTIFEIFGRRELSGKNMWEIRKQLQSYFLVHGGKQQTASYKPASVLCQEKIALWSRSTKN